MLFVCMYVCPCHNTKITPWAEINPVIFPIQLRLNIHRKLCCLTERNWCISVCPPVLHCVVTTSQWNLTDT